MQTPQPEHKSELLKRLARVEGQIRGIQKLIQNDTECEQVLQQMTAHIDSGAPLPRALFDKMLAARNFQSGLQIIRQIEFSLFDMRLHSDFDPSAWDAGNSSVLELLAEVRREVAVIVPPEWNRFPNSFSHIFAGGYGAGYFSYKWAEVLSADCYAAFEETGNPFDPATGKRFLSEILSVGGARPALDNFRAFRGREPQVGHLGQQLDQVAGQFVHVVGHRLSNSALMPLGQTPTSGRHTSCQDFKRRTR